MDCDSGIFSVDESVMSGKVFLVYAKERHIDYEELSEIADEVMEMARGHENYDSFKSFINEYAMQLENANKGKNESDRPWWEVFWDTITFQEAPERLDGLVQAIHDHFGPPKDWRTNEGGELAEVIPVH